MKYHNIIQSLESMLGMKPKKMFNDYSCNLINDHSLFDQLSIFYSTDIKRFSNIKKHVLKNSNSTKSDWMVFLFKGYIEYIEKRYRKAFKYFSTAIEIQGTDIDVWISLAFSLIHIKGYYNLGRDLLFNLYHFIYYYHKFNVHTLNIENLTAIARTVKNSPAYKNTYLQPVKFSEDFMIISRKCNNNCMTCPNIYGKRNFEIIDFLAEAGMSVYDYISLKVKDKAIKTLYLSGGEPTILKDFHKMIKYILVANKNVNVIAETNGRMFSHEDFLSKILDCSRDRLSFKIALHSHLENVHDQITRVKRSFKQTMEGMENLLKNNFSLEVNILLSEMNYRDIALTINYLEQVMRKYKTLRDISLILPVSSGSYLKNFGLSHERVKKMYNYANKEIGKLAGNKAERVSFLNAEMYVQD